MSEINLYGNEEYWGEIFPGYQLVRLVNVVKKKMNIGKKVCGVLSIVMTLLLFSTMTS